MKEKPTKACYEISWEICNMVGGIHTVIAGKVPEMQKHFGENYITIGPDLSFQNSSQSEFRREQWDEEIFRSLSALPFPCRMGRWLVPGEPKCILVNFEPLFAQKDQILAEYWERYCLDSLSGGHDYYEPLLFGHAVGLVIEHLFCNTLPEERIDTVLQFHEWLSASTILYLQEKLPEVGTIFTTHATVLGRALSGSDPQTDLLSRLTTINPETSARQNHVVSKHSLESLGARVADCFTTVSSITGEECAHLLNHKPDLITENGLGSEWPPHISIHEGSVQKARNRLLDIAESVTKTHYDGQKTLLCAISGRYEFANKGGDLFLYALSDLRKKLRGKTDGKVLAFFMFPAGVGESRQELLKNSDMPGILTHDLLDEAHDPVMKHCKKLKFQNAADDTIHIVSIPIYLKGTDSFIPENYLELLLGMDLGVFPSWYEPWGYTPHEATCLGVPSITSDLAGFGQWSAALGDFRETGVSVLPRRGKSFDQSKEELTQTLHDYFHLSPEERQEIKQKARNIKQLTQWENLISSYLKAYDLAMENTSRRQTSPSIEYRLRSCSLWHKTKIHRDSPHSSHKRIIQVEPVMPPPLDKIYDLSKENLWWSWSPEVTKVFSALDPDLWVREGRDIRRFLEQLDPKIYAKALESSEFRNAQDRLLEKFEQEINNTGDKPKGAFFSMEFGLAENLKFYSGGLGVLAGDYLKTLSDCHFPMVGIGLAYHFGYCRQTLSPDGRPEINYERNDFSAWPMIPVCNEDQKHLILSIPFPDEPVNAQVWKIQVGSVPLYLLDTDLIENAPENRNITHSLYAGDNNHRIRQEWVLGLGGMELLKNLNCQPSIYHINEGHSAFLIFSRIADFMAKDWNFYEAWEAVRGTTIFTTHTPVPAGHDNFSPEAIQPYLELFASKFQIPVHQLLELGQGLNNDHGNNFSTTALALHGSRFTNSVSEIHCRVSKQLFQPLFEEYFVDEIPIKNVTNGVHAATWIAPEWQKLFNDTLGENWNQRLQDSEFWEKIHHVDPMSIWKTHKVSKDRLKDKLNQYIMEKLQNQLENHKAFSAVLATLEQDPIIFTHARRAAPYKRAELLFYDRQGLKTLLQSGKPILFLYAGKAHPNNEWGQAIIQRIGEQSQSEDFCGHILYLENYEIELARLLVSGSDVWVNIPVRPLEACGTSGMKAAMNGCLNASVGDGWWVEGYNTRNGWLIGGNPMEFSKEMQDEYDHRCLLNLLQNEIIPLYFDQDETGMPIKWVERMKESIASLLPKFNSQEMYQNYHRLSYEPALNLAETLSTHGIGQIRNLVDNKNRLQQNWGRIHFKDFEIKGVQGKIIQYGKPFRVTVNLEHPEIQADELCVQIVLDQNQIKQKKDLEIISKANHESSVWQTEMTPDSLGTYHLHVRVLSRLRLKDLELEITPELIHWL